MIYKYDGHTYTAQAMQKKLRFDYRELGIGLWRSADLDKMIEATERHGLPVVEKLRKDKWKADRHISHMVVPHEAQLATLWEMNIPLESCLFVDNKLVSMMWNKAGHLLQYTIWPDGQWRRNIYTTNRKAKDNG